MDIQLPSALGFGRLDAFLTVLSGLRSDQRRPLRLSWSRVNAISPAGFAMLAVIFDSAVEHQHEIENVFMKKSFKELPIVKNFLENSRYKKLPKPSIHNQELKNSLLSGQESGLDISFAERLEMKFHSVLSEELAFSCRLILNELMQNSIDHSTSERYYLYAGIWEANRGREFQVGVLDMGVTIPSKLEQKYSSDDDQGYLELALQEGVTTRRSRPGGLGLHHTFEHLKSHGGTLTVISRDAQLIRYFKDKKIMRKKTKFTLNGTWCMARFPLDSEKK